MNSIGIIVPVYNVKEEYLRECIDSLLAQTYKNIQIYLVDDHSQEWCAHICDEIGRLDNRITVIHHEKNVGMSGARNTGLNHCDTKWVAFVDGDDWVDCDMCERFVQYLADSKDDPDIYMFSGYRSYPNHEEANQNEKGIKEYRTREQIEQLQVDALTTFIVGKPDNIVPFDSAWGKFYKRAYLLANSIEFRDLIFREDGLYFQEVTEHTTNIVYSPDLLYHYRMSENSIVNAYRGNAPHELEKFLELLWDFAKREGKGQAYDRALYGAAFFAMQTVITNYYYHPKCDLSKSRRRKACIEYFQKKYFAGVFDEFPLNTIKKNHRFKMLLLRCKCYGGIQFLRTIYLKLHKRTCFQ